MDSAAATDAPSGRGRGKRGQRPRPPVDRAPRGARARRAASATSSTGLYYMMEWLMLERMAAINSPRIDTVDFTQPAFDQLRSMLRVKIQQAKNAQQVRDGRPIR